MLYPLSYPGNISYCTRKRGLRATRKPPSRIHFLPASPYMRRLPATDMMNLNDAGSLQDQAPILVY